MPWIVTRFFMSLEATTMNVNKLTLKVQEALGEAQAMAIRSGHQQIDLEHLLTALLEQENGLERSRSGCQRLSKRRSTRLDIA